MKRDIIKKGAVYAIVGQVQEWVEILSKPKNGKVSVMAYKLGADPKTFDIIVNKLCPIQITEKLLLALSFVKRSGQLYGLPNMDYYQWSKNNLNVEFINHKGIVKMVLPSPNSCFGCKFVVTPLHVLQDLIGKIDVEKVLKNGTQ